MRARSTSVKPLLATELEGANVDPLFMVWIVARSTEDLLDTLLAPAGLTSDELAIYSVLAASPGITPGELGRWMAAPLTSVSSYVKRMTARGHVTRKPHPTDGRSYRIYLTAAGEQAHQTAVILFAPVRARVIDSLGDQNGTVRESLLRVRNVVDTLRDDRKAADSSRGTAARGSAATVPAVES